MHTSSYNRVIEKFKLSEREYLDGFSAADFTGLSSEERGEVRDILYNRASRGDNVALEAMRVLLSKDEYLYFLDKLIFAQPVNELFYAQLVTSACRVRGGDDEWANVTDCLSSDDVSTRRWVVMRLPDLPVPEQL